MLNLLEIFQGLHPVQQVLLATAFTWAMTALGAAGVFLTKTLNRNFLQAAFGFAAGVMIAASFFSLLNPAIEMTADLGDGTPTWLPAVSGFLLGGAFLWGVDKLLPHLHIGLEQSEGIQTNWQRSVLLVMAITLHNLPEGLAVGVAFGAVAAGLPSANLTAAIALALGIGIQNFPEGFAVSMPLRSEGLSRFRSFWYGQLSGIVEPLAGLLGVLAVLAMLPLLPYALSFAAGAMIYVVVEQLIPESQIGAHTDIGTLGVMAGFAIMMWLDVALS